MKIYYIGIGGFGMSGLAEYSLKAGNIVSGSDLTKTKLTSRLESLGIKINYTQTAKNITNDIDLAVYSSAISEKNEEFNECRKKGIKLLRRADYLGEIVNNKYLIAVSGTHGKTSTSAMISKVLIESGYDPTVFVGGSLEFLENGTSRIGSGNIAIVEADEYDKSFLTLIPDILVITGIEKDHSDIYKNTRELKDTFKKLINQVKENGKIIVCGDDKNVLEVCKNINANQIIYYGFDDVNSIRAVNVKYEMNDIGKIEYDYWTGHKTIGKCRLSVTGEHNVLNSLAAALATGFVGVTMQTFEKCIVKYKGVSRRLELKYKNDIFVYDDYAHHPTEVKASLKTLKAIHGEKILVVFQPHLFTRTKDFYVEFAESLSIADYIVLLEIYPARETPVSGITSNLIAKELKKFSKADYIYLKDNEMIYSYLNSKKSEYNVIIFQGAGDITNYCEMFIKNLK